MKSTSEAGMSTYAGHFQMLMGFCERLGIRYNPQSPALQIPAMRAQLTEVQAAINAVDVLIPVYVTAESARKNVFALMPPIATRIQAAAAVADLPDAIMVHIKEAVRKIRGERAKKITVDEAAQNGDTPVKHASVSQRSFNEQIEHFSQLIELVASQPSYAPSETELSIPSLRTLLSNMRNANNDVMAATTPLTAARQARDLLLFAPKTGMIDTALAVKLYVKAAFGAQSPEFKEANHISFKNRKI
jgi:hypothetical protein